MLKKILLGLVFFVASTAHAGSWITSDGTAKITKIQTEGGLTVVWFDSIDRWVSADGCTVQGKAILQDDTKNGDRQYAALLAAFATGKPIMMFGSGCVSAWGTTFPKIWSVISVM
ncbi:MAG TPA: hypothetical protein PKZ52_03410 [Cellvibrionaceae bacterium]|nr:hypothetical protein [Cellvibrionaceae bacterium]